MRNWTSWILSTLLLMSGFAYASPNTLTYQGRIVKSNGVPLEYGNVSFLFEIASPNGSCIVYREQKDGVSMIGSGGVFDVPIGTGTKLFPADPSFAMLDAFNNSQVLNCVGGSTYTPVAGDIRILKVQFHDGTGWMVVSPNNEIRSVPYAAYALSAEKLGTKQASDFVLKTGVPDCLAAGKILTADANGFSCVADQGGAGVITSVSGSGPIQVTGTGNVTVSATVGTVAGTLAAGDDSRFTNARTPSGSASGDLSGSYPNPTVSKIQSIAVSSTVPSTAGQVLRFDSTQWTPDVLGVSDITGLTAALGSKIAQSQFPGSCLTNQTLTFLSPSGSFTCSNIAIAGSQVSGNIAGSAAGFTGNLSGDVSGSQTATSVDKLKGKTIGDVSSLADNQVLKWNAGAQEWRPGSDNSSQWLDGANSSIYYSAGPLAIGNAPTDVTQKLSIGTTETNLNRRGLNIDLRNDVTADGSYSNLAAVMKAQETVAAGVTNSGSLTGTWQVAFRNNLPGTVDNGTLAMMRGSYVQYGHYNSEAAATPLTTTAYGVFVSPYYRTGTISTMYDYYAHAGATGGTVTNHYGLYIAGTQKKNVLEGSLGIGTSSPTRPLHVAQSVAAGANSAPLMLERVNASGTPAANDLTMMQFKMPNSSGTTVVGADLGATLESVTPGAEKGALVFRTSANGGSTIPERLRINSSGYVGIGTTTPTSVVHIKNAVNLNTGTNFADGVSSLRIDDGSSIGLLFDTNQIEQMDSTNAIYLNHNSAANVVINYGLGSGGKVGIGVLSPAYKLDVLGGVNASGGYTQVSDRRLKKDIHSLENSLDLVLKLNPVNYYWKDSGDDSSKQLGFIAQEVEEIFPEVVKTDSTGRKAMSYSNLISPVVAAIKEFYARFNGLEERVSALEKQNEILRQQNEELIQLLKKQQTTNQQ